MGSSPIGCRPSGNAAISCSIWTHSLKWCDPVVRLSGGDTHAKWQHTPLQDAYLFTCSSTVEICMQYTILNHVLGTMCSALAAAAGRRGGAPRSERGQCGPREWRVCCWYQHQRGTEIFCSCCVALILLSLQSNPVFFFSFSLFLICTFKLKINKNVLQAWKTFSLPLAVSVLSLKFILKMIAVCLTM